MKTRKTTTADVEYIRDFKAQPTLDEVVTLLQELRDVVPLTARVSIQGRPRRWEVTLSYEVDIEGI